MTETTLKTPIQRAAENPSSRKLAIAAKCWECMGGAGTPGAKRLVGECVSVRCPLHPLRPWQRDEDDDVQTAENCGSGDA